MVPDNGAGWEPNILPHSCFWIVDAEAETMRIARVIERDGIDCVCDIYLCPSHAWADKAYLRSERLEIPTIEAALREMSEDSERVWGFA